MLINHGIGRNAHRCHIDGTLTRAASRLYRRSQIQRQFWTCAERGKQGYKNKKRVATKETLLSGKVRHVGRRGGALGRGVSHAEHGVATLRGNFSRLRQDTQQNLESATPWETQAMARRRPPHHKQNWMAGQHCATLPRGYLHTEISANAQHNLQLAVPPGGVLATR